MSSMLRGNTVVAQFFSFAAASFSQSGDLVVAVQHSDSLYLGRFPDGPFRAIHVPQVERRGPMRDIVRQARPGDQASIARAAYRPSYPLVVAPFGESSSFVLITSDQVFTRNRMTGVIHVSLVDTLTGRTCVDARLDAPTDPLPMAAVREDTVFVLAQEERQHGRNVTEVKKFRLVTDRCRLD